MDEKELLQKIAQAKEMGDTVLELAGEGLTSVPPELAQLTNLEALDLSYNQLTSLPPELAQLTNLQTLDLRVNQLIAVPETLGKLKNLRTLNVRVNSLGEFPKVILRLKALRGLDLSFTELKEIPEEISELDQLERLVLSGNELSQVPGSLIKLKRLAFVDLRNNQFVSIPQHVYSLFALEMLDFSNQPWCEEFGGTCITYSNRIGEVSPQILGLSNLKTLRLGDNAVEVVPREIGQLTNLETLEFSHNQLTSVPRELAQLTNLRQLYLHANQLTSVPPELGQLTSLQELYLQGNQLTSLPPELGRLQKLRELRLAGNPLESPPPEVVKQGTKAVLAYLRELEKGKKRKWEAKLLIVGEAGVGKTELVKALHGDDFGGETATEGVEIRALQVDHPREPGVTMRLNLWDFGGQEIQHATHQFFYSERALFVLAWNARENYEQAKLNKWLELIQARASVPGDEESGREGWTAPVLLVATHRDLWKPDIPYEELRKQFPRIRFLGMLAISNKKRTGIEELRKALVEAAADLPLMGTRWPAAWQKVEDELAKRVEAKASRMRLEDLWQIVASAGVAADSHEPLARALDGMGKVRVFLDDPELREVVVLDPQWLTNRIARVLKNEDKDEKAVCEHAILHRKHWKVFWPEDDEGTHRLFVRMMRSFDLVYALEDTPDAWLVVQLLPYQLPEKERQRHDKLWSSFQGRHEIAMKFRLEQSIPPGIPTWFIAREHRFSLELHWRLGVLLADNPREPRHLGLVQAFPEQRYLQLTVRGTLPHNFFVLLRDGLEYTFARFPGLRIKRTVPCPGHPPEKCAHEFDLRQLSKAIEKEKPKLEMECPEALDLVSVPAMLFGIHWSTQDEIFRQIRELKGEVLSGNNLILTQLGELTKLSEHYFLALFNAQQRLEESHCPNVFAVLPKDESGWLKDLLGQPMVMQLYCQAPGQWHPTVDGGRYEIKNPRGFIATMGPYIVKLAKVIKYATPVAGAAAGAYAGPVGAVMGAKFAKDVAGQIKLTEELANKLSERDYGEADLLERTGVGARAERLEGAELRALRNLLDEVDAAQHWGGLKKVLTPEGHYLWLCAEHAEEYRR